MSDKMGKLFNFVLSISCSISFIILIDVFPVLFCCCVVFPLFYSLLREIKIIKFAIKLGCTVDANKAKEIKNFW